MSSNSGSRPSSIKTTTEAGLEWPLPYLASIEKKKKNVLLHDMGQGAPCLKCGDKCPGFSLHYWRKVCRNCRCHKEDHDIKDEEDPGIRKVGRLFDEEPLPAPKIVPLARPAGMEEQIGISGVVVPLQYEWIPPGASVEAAKKYMEALPLEKQPIKGSDGAAIRKRLLERQIPDHDIDPEACDDLTSAEINKMNEFVEKVKQEVVGQGMVIEQPQQARWFCFACSKPMYFGEVAIFADRAGKNRCWHPQCFTCFTCHDILQDLIYYFHESKIYCGRHYADSVLPRCSACDELIFNREYTLAEQKPWHVKHFCCNSCDKPLAGKEYVSEKGFPYCPICHDREFGKKCSTCEKRIAANAARIIWNDYNYHARRKYFAMLNASMATTEDKLSLHERVERHSGINHFQKQECQKCLVYTYLFLNEAYCACVVLVDTKLFSISVVEVLAAAEPLTGQQREETQSDKVNYEVTTEEKRVKKVKKTKKRDSDGGETTTIETTTFTSDGSDPRYNRESVESYNRGESGDREIVYAIDSKTMNKDWQTSHFCCWQCDDSLTGQRYVLRDDHPYCIRCYEQVFSNQCEECGRSIGIDSKDLSYKEKHWHESCFLCQKCRVSLVDKPFGSKNEKVYCANCYDAAFASRCDGCSEVFRAGTKKMEYKGRQWHEKCFACVVCKTAIGTKSFIPRENDIYCTGCYEEKFATRCVKCNKIITSGGVTYKNEPWHRECFTCTNCNTSLAGQRFTSRDEKPYCADCFGDLFAKRCTSCTRPITGIGGTRFISFEDRHWHNDCFICAVCRNSLVGKGFITDNQDVLCPECAKERLL
ncbi:hypothetical protein CHUAL_008247 [Chamberlinius hualienensis]